MSPSKDGLAVDLDDPVSRLDAAAALPACLPGRCPRWGPGAARLKGEHQPENEHGANTKLKAGRQKRSKPGPGRLMENERCPVRAGLPRPCFPNIFTYPPSESRRSCIRFRQLFADHFGRKPMRSDRREPSGLGGRSVPARGRISECPVLRRGMMVIMVFHPFPGRDYPPPRCAPGRRP
jgi:hypothetical protein